MVEEMERWRAGEAGVNKGARGGGRRGLGREGGRREISAIDTATQAAS